MTFSVTLPWPDRTLSPNVRLAWQARQDAKKAARDGAYALAFDAWDHVGIAWRLGPLAARYELYPPNRRKIDIDNLVAMLKSAQDGVCIALNINDSQIREATYTLLDPVPGGKVVMTIQVLTEATP